MKLGDFVGLLFLIRPMVQPFPRPRSLFLWKLAFNVDFAVFRCCAFFPSDLLSRASYTFAPHPCPHVTLQPLTLESPRYSWTKVFILPPLRKSYGASVYLADKLHRSRSPFPPVRFVSIPSTVGPCELRGYRDTYDREKYNPYATLRPLG